MQNEIFYLQIKGWTQLFVTDGDEGSIAVIDDAPHRVSDARARPVHGQTVRRSKHRLHALKRRASLQSPHCEWRPDGD